MAKKNFWAILWSISRPILTLGLSLIINNVAKKTGPFENAVNEAGTQLENSVLETVENSVNDSTAVNK